MKNPISIILRKNLGYQIIIGSILLLIIPAYFFNLGTLRFIDDEAIRALVALEMKLSGDYITPTLGGEFYFKKPPLFNWILAGAFSITNQYSEITPRLVNMFFLIVYCLTIFFIIKKRYDAKKGFLSAILFLTCGRVILYETLFGLIDMTFSWLIFSNFILIYHFFKRKRYLLLYLVSYTITGIAFLMKGLPPIAFQGITLLVAAFSLKDFRALFSWKHIVGCIPFFIITALYYYIYWTKNPEQFTNLINTIFHESADKSVVNYGLMEIIKNVFSYSFEIIYNFVPGTFVLLFFIKRKPFELLKKDPFLYYLARVFLFNVIIYLISPVTYMRYVLMLMPLVFILFVEYYDHYRKSQIWQIKFLHIVIAILPFLIFFGTPVYPLVEATGFVRHAWLKAVIIMLILVPITYYLFKLKKYKLEFLVLSILVFRIGFNAFILPSRVHEHSDTEAKRQTIELASNTLDKPMYRYNTYLPKPVLFYATAERMEIIHYKTDFRESGYYLAKDIPVEYYDRIVDSLMIRADSTLCVVKIE